MEEPLINFSYEKRKEKGRDERQEALRSPSGQV